MNSRPARKTILTVLSLVIWTVVGCTDPQPSYDEVLEEGLREYEAGRYADAVAMFKMAAAKDAERPEPSYQLGRCYLAMADQQFVENDLPGALRKCDRAISAFDKAISAFPGYSRAVQGKADALKLKGQQIAAFEIANWVAAQSAFEAKKLILGARQYADAGDLDSAQLSYIKAAAVEPDNARAHAELGLFYLRLDNKPEAIRSLRRAYELNPGAPGVFTTLMRLGATPAYPENR